MFRLVVKTFISAPTNLCLGLAKNYEVNNDMNHVVFDVCNESSMFLAYNRQYMSNRKLNIICFMTAKRCPST